MKQDVLPVILGASCGAYALAHAFFHDYGIVPLVLDEEIPPLFSHTFCAYADEIKNIRKAHILYRVLEDIGAKAEGKSLLLIPADGDFLSLVAANTDVLSKSFLIPHLPTPAEKKTVKDTASAVLLYKTGSGECRTVYAKVLANAPSGEITALLTEDIPLSTLEAVKAEAKALRRGIYLFYEDKEGSLVRESAVLPPLLAFCAAKDASIPEWMIYETVISEPLPETQARVSALFTLFPYRKTKRFLTRQQRKTVRRAQKCALYTLKEEGPRREVARVFKELYQAHITEN